MWLDSEIARLESLYGKLDKTDINQVLPTEELQVISDLSEVELENIANKLFIPKVGAFPISFFSFILSINWNGRPYDSLV